jgi:Ulp1 family protease
MNSHFVSKLCFEQGGYDYSKVQRWTSVRRLEAGQLDYFGGIADLDKVIIPVHLGNHWVCLHTSHVSLAAAASSVILHLPALGCLA